MGGKPSVTTACVNLLDNHYSAIMAIFCDNRFFNHMSGFVFRVFKLYSNFSFCGKLNTKENLRIHLTSAFKSLFYTKIGIFTQFGLFVRVIAMEDWTIPLYSRQTHYQMIMIGHF